MKVRTAALSQRLPCLLYNGSRIIEAGQEEFDVTHLEISSIPVFMGNLLVNEDLRSCPTVEGKWWVMPNTPGGTLRHVLAVCYDSIPQWSEISIFLSYLSLVMLLPSEYSKVFITEEMQAAAVLMRELFHPEHPVWEFIVF